MMGLSVFEFCIIGYNARAINRIALDFKVLHTNLNLTIFLQNDINWSSWRYDLIDLVVRRHSYAPSSADPDQPIAEEDYYSLQRATGSAGINYCPELDKREIRRTTGSDADTNPVGK